MKFYYNGKLIRTSKNHVYTHAVINMDTNNVKGCRANLQNAEAIISGQIATYEKEIKNCETAIKALKAGKKYYTVRFSGHTIPIHFENGQTPETFAEYINDYREQIEYVRKNWKVVELEAR